MGWLDTWYPAATAGIAGLRGVGAAGSDGVKTSLLTGTDTIGVLGQLSPAVVTAIKTWFGQTASSTVAGLGVPSSDQVNADGTFVGIPSVNGSDWISVEAYVAGSSEDTGAAYKRSVIPGTATYEVYISSDETDVFSLVRGMIDSWQHCVDASAAAIESCGVDASQLVSTQSLATFWDTVRVLCGNLDQLQQNPPLALADRIQQAAVDALHKAENFAGEAAAQLSTEVGKAAGNVGAGFFSQAGMTAVIVAGIAVFLYIR